MKSKQILIALAVAAGGALAWQLHQSEAAAQHATQAHGPALPGCEGAGIGAGIGADASAGCGAPGAQGGRQWLSAAGAEGEVKRVPLPPVDSSSPAWLSMAAAREHGDARTPPLQREAEPRDAPSAAQLADMQAYSEYERGQHARLLTAYVNAADTELPRLRADLERGRAAGIPELQLAKVEEKIRRIEQQRGLAAARTGAARTATLQQP